MEVGASIDVIMAFLLNSDSIILCPHGGMILHTPLSATSYRVNGRFPMLFGDLYQIAGCPFMSSYGSPCNLVSWVTASNLLIVKGQPALIATSVGLCVAASGVSQGPAIIAAIRSSQLEPDTFTAINY